MKRKLEKWKDMMWKCVTPLVLLITTVAVNSTCMFEFYQPKMPMDGEKLKRF